MPSTYEFKDSKTSDSVSKALMFMSKFSRNQAIIKLSDTSVSIVWSIPTKTIYIHTEITAPDMFKDKLKYQQLKLSDTIIETDPSVLGRTMKGFSQDKSLKLCVVRPDHKIKVIVGSEDSSKRTLVHKIPCIIKTPEDYNSMLMSEMEHMCNLKYDTKCYVRNIHRLKLIVESFDRNRSIRFYIFCINSSNGHELTLKTITQGSEQKVHIRDLEDGFTDGDNIERFHTERRNEAGAFVDTKKVLLFLSNMISKDRSRICISIIHNNLVKLTLVNESIHGERSYQSLLIPAQSM